MAETSAIDSFWELLDDIEDFYVVTKKRGLGEAARLTSEKLFGLDAPEMTGAVDHGDGYTTESIRPGITKFTQFGDEDHHSMGQFLDPEAFTWGDGISKISLDGDRDVAFAGRPGEYTNWKNEEWQDFDLTKEKYRKKGITDNDVKWMVPGKDGRGLSLVSGDIKPENGLTKILKIYDIKDELKSYKTGKARHDKLLKKHKEGTSKFLSANYTEAEIIEKERYYSSFKNFSMPENGNLFKGHDTYNFALAKDGKIKTILNINSLGFPNNDFNNPKESIIHEAIISALLSFEADEVYYLDAGQNKDWQIGRTRMGDYDYDATSTIGGVHIGYE